MEKFVIEGGERLRGSVRVSGSKNAVLPVLAATLLAEGAYRITSVPALRDVGSMVKLLSFIGAKCERTEDNALIVDTTAAQNYTAPYEMVKEMRASVLVLGALVGRLKRAVVSYPGGCAIGVRPIDLHLKGLTQLGCDVRIHEGYVDVRADKLRGGKVAFDSSTVGGTENILMAAVLAEGETIIQNAAREPEVVDLADMLVKMGAQIDGIGTETLRIKGVDGLTRLRPQGHPRPHRGGDLPRRLRHHARQHNPRRRQGGPPEGGDREAEGSRHGDRGKGGALNASMTRKRPMAFDAKTLAYPGFPTDMQAQVMALMCITGGSQRDQRDDLREQDDARRGAAEDGRRRAR